jgi:two-component system OmpR family sensor kinase
MGVLVEDLLLLARLDQGRPLERRRVDFAALVADAVEDARAADPERRLELSSEHPLVLAGDELRLRQVVGNLIDNARTHTPPGSPVSVRLTGSNGTAVLEVVDHGPGISPEQADRIFERFYRGDPSRSRSSGGSGLGLSIASAIVQAHGGDIAVKSTPGEGATFVVTLPVDQDSGRGSEAQADEALHPDGRPSPFGPLSVGP